MLNEHSLDALKAVAAERLQWSRGFVSGLWSPMSDAQLLTRPGPKANHTMWVMGHLATVDDLILQQFAKVPTVLPATWPGLFSFGSKPTDNASDYPSRSEINDALALTRKRFIDWVLSLDLATAQSATPERLAMLAPNVITVPFALVAHEMMHGGQVTSARAVLGFPPMIG